MPEAPVRCSENVKLKGPPGKPYNSFSIQYARIHGTGKTKASESDRTLVHPRLLGLNVAWLHNRCPPVDQTDCEEQKAEIRKLHLKFPYWGHLIYNSIQKFNASSPSRYRKLVYDLRHGEADHNAWKSLFKKVDPLLWTKNPEYKRQPIIEYRGKQYCIIDPPLTARGVQQAKDARETFRELKRHMFPMPKRAYVSPLLRTMQTFEYSLEGLIESEDAYILDDLREQETGNCADILIDEYLSRDTPKLPPLPGTDGKAEYMETDDAVRKRAARLHRDIFRRAKCDCIIRVTHSLLIRNNLKNLVDGDEEVLKNFMLAEGGLFAYVVEGYRPGRSPAQQPLKQSKSVARRKKEVGWRRASAFKSADASTTPADVPIERAITLAM